LTFVTLAAVLLPGSVWASVPDGGTSVEQHHRAKEFDPAPTGGFALERHKAQVMLEAGYPFVRFELGYGLLSNLQVFAGYQGLYSFTSAGYAGIKLGLITTPKKTFGLSLAALGGYTHLRHRGDALAAALVGGNGGFGEFRLQLSGRRGRHGFFFNAGMRMSQVTRNIRCEKGAEPECMEHFNCLSDDPVLTTVFVEAGYEVRLSRYASYFVGVGVDVFSGAWYPAMARLRNGILFDF
jgi:hypothetical protein